MLSDPPWQDEFSGCSARRLFCPLPGQILPLFPPRLGHKRKKKQKKRRCLCEPGPCVGEKSPAGTVPVSDLCFTGKGWVCHTPAPRPLPARDAQEWGGDTMTPRNGPGTTAHPPTAPRATPGGANTAGEPGAGSPDPQPRSDVKAVQAPTCQEPASGEGFVLAAPARG